MNRFDDISAMLASLSTAEIPNLLDELKSVATNTNSQIDLKHLCAKIASELEKVRRATSGLQEVIVRYRNLERLIPGVVFMHVVNPDGSSFFRYISAKAKDFYGLNPKEILRNDKNLFDLIHPDDRPRVEGNIRHTAKTLEPPRNVFRHIVHGKVSWHEVFAHAERTANGQVLADGITFDITELKRIEEELREKEERLRMANEAAQIGTFVTDIELNCAYWSDELCQIFGVPPCPKQTIEEAIRVIQPEDLERFLAARQKGLEPSGSGKYYSEHRIVRPDGEVRWVLVRGRTIFRETPRGKVPSKSIGACVDITERRLMENTLRASEVKFAKIFHASPQGLIITKFDDGCCLEVNSSMCKLTGYCREELIGKSVVELGFYVEPEDRKRLLNLLNEKESVHNFKTKFRHKSGELRWGLIEASTIDLNGEKSLLGSISDCTDIHRAHEMLRINEERFRIALDGASDGIWDWDLKSRQMYFSSRCYTMIGYEPNEFPAAYDAWLQLIHPNDVEAIKRAAKRAILEHSQFSIEFRIRAKNGTWAWVLSRGKVAELDATGKAIRLAGSHTDISEQKRTEQALENRLFALTTPIDDTHPISMEDLVNIKDLQKLQDFFASSCGVASLITRPDGAPITMPSNFTTICSEIIRKTPKGLSNCERSDKFMSSCSSSEPIIHPCLSLGLYNAAASITVGGQHIANWLIGQARPENFNEEKAIEYAQEIGADEAHFRSAFQQVPIMSIEKFRQISNFLFALANQISNIAYQNMQQARFIADRKRAEETLRKYESIVSSSHDLMALINRDYIYEAVNESFLEYHGKHREEVIGRNVPDIIGLRFFEEKTKKRLDRALKGKRVNYRASFDFAGAGRRTTNINYFPILDKFGKVEGVVLNVRDITDTLELEERLIQSQRIESIGTLAGGVAHEINNPINGIMNYAQMIFDRCKKKGPTKDLAAEIMLESERISEIVKNLLAFARQDDQPVSQEQISDMIDSVLCLIRTVMRHDDIVLEIDIEPDMPPINCRGQRIQQVLMNLLTNSRDALNARSTDAGAEKKIKILVRQLIKDNRQFIRTTIEDNGTGIPDAIKGKIFDPFFTTKPKGIGTGLGLSITYGIVKELGGELAVESVPGEFTRFHMDLPATP